MRTSFFSLLAIVLVLASHAVAQIMPAIVNEVPEARALWNTLHNQHHLPTDYSTRELQQFNQNNWHLFLKGHGDDIVTEGWAQLPKGRRTAGMKPINKLRKLVQNPSSVRQMLVENAAAKTVASQLIEAYAKSLKEGDHIYAVNEHLHLPDDADHLFVPGSWK